jgi:predicted porin
MVLFSRMKAMKKSLVALAALALVGAASAQSSVTLYGKADLWVGKIKGGKFQAGTDGLASSRLGVMGTEDLGGGLKAHFNFEQYLNLANGATNNPAAGTGQTWDRQANVGFSGGFGTVKLGKSWNALDDMYGAANSGFDSALSANKVWLNSYTGTAAAQIYYATPEVSGFSGVVSTQLSGNAAAGRTSAFHVKYANGPIYAGVGYENDQAGGQKGTMVNGSYDLGKAKLLGSYYTSKPTLGARTNSYQIGADIPLSGALTLSVGYANSKVKGGRADSAFSVAAGYALSKRTMVYGGFRAESRKSGAADMDIFAVGVNHSF